MKQGRGAWRSTLGDKLSQERWHQIDMYIYRTLISVTILALLAQPFAMFGQSSNDWAAVRPLGSGTEIRVETRSGKKYDGRLQSVSDANISLLHKGQLENIPSSDVKKVSRYGGGSRGKSVAIGAAAGAGAGAGIGGILLASTGGSDNTGGVIAPFIAAGAAIGGVLGALLPGKKKKLVYEAN